MEEATWKSVIETLGSSVHVLTLFLDHDHLLPWEVGSWPPCSVSETRPPGHEGPGRG